MSVLYHIEGSTRTFIGHAPLIIDFPRNQWGYAQLIAAVTNVDLQADVTPVPPITVHNKGPITNELLCYVSCKIIICTFDVIVKMCTDFYDSGVIAAAKDDLMSCVTLPEDDKRSGRRRVNLKEVHMKDIVSILLEIKPEDVPVFLAGDLNNVPPRSLNNFDMSRIITDMELGSTKIPDENLSRSSGNRP